MKNKERREIPNEPALHIEVYVMGKNETNATKRKSLFQSHTSEALTLKTFTLRLSDNQTRSIVCTKSIILYHFTSAVVVVVVEFLFIYYYFFSVLIRSRRFYLFLFCDNGIKYVWSFVRLFCENILMSFCYSNDDVAGSDGDCRAKSISSPEYNIFHALSTFISSIFAFIWLWSA